MFIQKNLDFPFQEVPGRKSVPRSSATPQTRENKGSTGLHSPEGSSISEQEAGSLGGRLLSPGAELMMEELTLFCMLQEELQIISVILLYLKAFEEL